MKSKRRTSFLDRLMYFLNIMAAIGILLSYLAYYINPSTITFFAMAALAYPVLLAINILFTLYWLLRLKWKILLPLLVIAIGYKHVQRTIRLDSTKVVAGEDDRLKVMSYNVRMFNAYEWIAEENIPEAIQDLIDRESPDVLLIQEYHKANIEPTLGYPYDYQKFTNEGRNYGLSIFSRFPIVHAGAYEYEQDSGAAPQGGNNEFIFADVLWNGDTIRFINVHFESFKLGAEEYERLRNPNQGSQDEIKRGFIKILKLLHRAFQQRGDQVASVEAAIAESPHPVILCGDFNDTPQSHTYHRLDNHLDDAYMVAGSGLSGTYSRGPMPFRIDHIFFDDALICRSYDVIREKFSDHYPVVAEFEKGS